MRLQKLDELANAINIDRKAHSTKSHFPCDVADFGSLDAKIGAVEHVVCGETRGTVI